MRRLQFISLSLAILFEVIGTVALKAADGFRAPLPTLLSLAAYAASFFTLSHALRAVPVGIAYAIWSGVGQVLVMLAAWLLYGQTLDLPAYAGIALILAGVLVLAICSTSMPH